LITVILNIFSDYFGRYLVTYGPSKISVFPKFTTPKMLLHLWVLMKNYARTHTLHYPHYLGNTISRWKRQKYVHMIRDNFHCVNLKPMIQSHFLKYPLHTLLYLSTKYPLPILRSPYQMIFRVIYGMWSSFHSHVQYIAHLSLPSAGKLFIPVHRTGYSSFKFS
jgi:hypothetical protein